MIAVRMPQLGLEVSEGRVSELLVSPGARVEHNQPLLELETDKAVTEVVAPSAGTVASIAVGVGDTVAIGARLLEPSGAGSEAPRAAPPRPTGSHATPAAPAARRAARSLGVA